MKITLTDKYITGSDIDLTPKMLGIIHQPKLIDLINKNIDVSSLTNFFIIVEHTHWKLKKESFGFDNTSKFQIALSLEKEFLENGKINLGFVHALSILYNTNIKDILIEKLDNEIVLFIPDKNVLIKEENFELFLDTMLGMFYITDSDVHRSFDGRNWVRNTGSEREEELIAKFEKRLKKKDEDKRLHLSDYINTVVHLGRYTYDYVLSLTYWQLMNSYNTLVSLDGYKDMLGYTWSYKYNVEKDNNPHWSEKAKIKQKTIDL